MEIITKNAKETFEFGRKFSTEVNKFVSGEIKGGTTIALVGDLGSGKTTFTQGFAKGLGIERIISPTFILMRSYQGKKNLYHLDLYRLEGNVERQLLDLGVSDFWGKPENILLIEWAEKAKEVLPKNTVWINFKYVDENSRKIIF